MLNLMRKHAQSWLIKALMAIIAVVFVLYFGTMRENKRKTKAAVVNGDVITIAEYEKAYDMMINNFRRQYQDLWSEALIKSMDLKNMALNNMIDQTLILQEADKLGFAVTKDEVQQAIMGMEAFKTDNHFDMRRYKALLNQQRMSAEGFEDSMGKQLLGEKLRQFLSSFSVVTDQEILDQYTYDNEQIKVSYIRFSPQTLEQAVTVNETGMTAFFEKNKERFRMPEKVKLAYVVFDAESFESEVSVSDEDIRSYYEYNMDRFIEPGKVRARHILFKVEPNAPEEQVKAVMGKAEKVLKQVRDGGDFAELAKKHSDGPTKEKGGDLGYFARGQMVKSFDEAAFNLEQGEISDIIRTRFGFHIIKMEDKKEGGAKPLDQVRETVRKILVANDADDMAYEKGRDIIDQMPYDVGLDDYVQEEGLSVRHTNFLTRDARIPGIVAEKDLMQTLFALDKNEVSDLREVGGKYYIFQVADRQPSFLPDMAVVKGQVTEAYKNFLASEKAESAAEDFLAGFQNGMDWQPLKDEYSIKQSGFFKRSGTLPQIDLTSDWVATLFKLKEEKRYPNRIFKDKNNTYIVFRWEAYQGIDKEKYESEKEKLRAIMIRKKHDRHFENWLTALYENSDIERLITP